MDSTGPGTIGIGEWRTWFPSRRLRELLLGGGDSEGAEPGTKTGPKRVRFGKGEEFGVQLRGQTGSNRPDRWLKYGRNPHPIRKRERLWNKDFFRLRKDRMVKIQVSGSTWWSMSGWIGGSHGDISRCFQLEGAYAVTTCPSIYRQVS